MILTRHDSFSFFNTESRNLSKVLEFFSDFKKDGRYINVEITDKKNRIRKKRRGKGRNDKRKNEVNSKRSSPKKSKDFKNSRPRRNRRK